MYRKLELTRVLVLSVFNKTWIDVRVRVVNYRSRFTWKSKQSGVHVSSEWMGTDGVSLSIQPDYPFGELLAN